jgi:hypothetical protein
VWNFGRCGDDAGSDGAHRLTFAGTGSTVPPRGVQSAVTPDGVGLATFSRLLPGAESGFGVAEGGHVEPPTFRPVHTTLRLSGMVDFSKRTYYSLFGRVPTLLEVPRGTGRDFAFGSGLLAEGKFQIVYLRLR